ncbi:hypothetical protein [Alsobacter sp. R-9]
MPFSRLACGTFALAVSIAPGTVIAQDAPPKAAPTTAGETLAQDPAVRESQDPELTPLGRNPPKVLPGEASPDLQQSMDKAHKGSTGTTTGQGQGRPAADAPDATGTVPPKAQTPP